MKTITTSEIIAMCRQVSDDAEAARRLGCSVFVVQTYRPLSISKKQIKIPASLPIPSPSTYKAKSKPRNEEGMCPAMLNEERSMEYASYNLLVRQLETGMHWLDKPRFLEVVADLGLRHRLPKNLTA